MSADPTIDLIAALDDSSLFEKRENVPVFVPHRATKTAPDGSTVEIEVTEDDLHAIAKNANDRLEQSGTPVAIFLGHRSRDPKSPETAQPPLAGYAREFRVGSFGPGKLTGLLCTQYIRKGKVAEAGEYPFRSVEYYSTKREITAVCHLKRDPELDLGIVAAYAHDRVLCYSKEVNMPDMPPPADKPADPTTPPDAAVTPQPPKVSADEQQRGDYERHCYSHPYARTHHEGMLAKYAAEAAGTVPGAAAGATPGLPGAAVPLPGEKSPPMNFAREAQMLQYERENTDLKRRLAVLEARDEQNATNRELIQYERQLERLAAQGVMVDIPKELKRCSGKRLDQLQAYVKEHLEDIAHNYQRDPAGYPVVRIDAADVEAAGDAEQGKITPRQAEVAKQYMRSTGCDWDDAMRYAVSGKAPVKVSA